ncbi:hypothetical protein [Marinobacterium sediminicola]|uniref:Uncharacterized protein n=1 Tax=Marinobacterium sediminicola TaxID=518898 RepID=A0ABY1S2W9_9GAMM|nr:hypothetical protein [Marinobacterium sediminicola]ULG70647.1 hypothetical protein LN244_07495 [Marinobacterium sediminicola]SMR77123.1 hypothetical protein SAMN04487964_1132 [Marinobacterium sediminicola]
MSVGGKHSIGIVGFAANEAAMLEIFFKGNKGEGFALSDSSQADALIVGCSEKEDHSQIEKLLGDQKLPVIAVVDQSTEHLASNASVTIRRPLTLGALQDALAKLRGRLDSASVASGVAVAVSEQEKAREEVFAEWQARKQRSSEALSAWKGDSAQREGEALRSRFSLERNELNSLILEAQHELQKQQASRPPKPAPEPFVEPEEKIQTPKLSAEMIQQCCGSLPDVNLDSPHERRRAYFSLDGLLLPWVQRCVRQGDETGNVQQVLGVPGAFFYLPAEKVFLVGIDADLLLQLTRTRFGFDEISLQERSAEAELPQGRKVAADELLWQLALFTSRGRVPDTLSAEQPKLLDEMPDFERLLETPHARSIAELWQSQRLSAQNIASMLGVPQRFVFSFFVAADAIGLFCP